MVLPIASTLHHTNDLVVREALACLVALLDGGNTLAQESFKQHFLGTREETFFDDVMSRMRRAADSVREQRIVFKEIRDEQEKQAALMGTLTLAGGMSDEIQAALNSLPETSTDDVDYAAPLRVEVAVRWCCVWHTCVVCCSLYIVVCCLFFLSPLFVFIVVVVSRRCELSSQVKCYSKPFAHPSIYLS